MKQLKGIERCGNCTSYNWEKHKCNVCQCVETDARSPFYDDCPLEDVQPIQRWIPCSERLPELYESVLVCYKTLGGVAQAVSERFEEDRWSALCGMKPIAWMPLPEPYKEEGADHD